MQRCPFCFKSFATLNKHLPRCTQAKQKHGRLVQEVNEHENQLTALREADQAFAEQQERDAAAAAMAAADFPMRDPTPPPPEIWPASGREKRSVRARQLPARFRDVIPDTVPVADVAPAQLPEPRPQSPVLEGSSAPARTYYRTPTNFEKIYKTYPQHPTHDPDAHTTLETLCASSSLLRPEQEQITSPAPPPSRPTYFPFSSYSSAWLMAWYFDNITLTLAGLKRLVTNVFRRPKFKISELSNGWDPDKELKRMDRAAEAFADELPKGWKMGAVTIPLPPPPGWVISEDDAPKITIAKIRYRPLLDILEEAVKGRSFNFFHTTPHALRLDPDYDPTSLDKQIDDVDIELDESGIPLLPPGHEDIYGEVYTSSEMLRLHSKLPPPPEGCRESVVAAFMFWSDATHLAQFGDTSLWPKYTSFGNYSKYLRCRPTAHACYQSAYFPKVPDWVKDEYKRIYDVDNIPDGVTAHLKRELMHAVWEQLILTPEFIHAYLHGHPIECLDEILRLFLPRFVTYGADYLEKILLALIRSNGGCPCVHCLIPKAKIQDLGTKLDARRREVNTRQDSSALRRAVKRAREFVFDLGFSIKGPRVEGLLKTFSWVPSRNAFHKIQELADPEFNFHDMLVPDLLHELELGVMKAVFIHVLRVLDATTKRLGDLDQRFRKVLSFGRATIRSFKRNVSEMKQFAARDYEDVFQCLLPVLDGLFIDGRHDKYDALIQDVCFDLLVFHGLAKMRLHTTSSVDLLRNALRSLGKSLRRFHRETVSIITVELPKEHEKRLRVKSKKAAKKGTSSSSCAPVVSEKPLEKPFNLNTPKIHLIGYYPDGIVRVGTTDSYSTQIGEALHHGPKQGFRRTNFKDVESQLAAAEHRERITREAVERMEQEAQEEANEARKKPNDGHKSLPEPEDDPLPDTPPRVHHHIGESKRTFFKYGCYPTLPGVPVHLDPAYKGFSRRVKIHFYQRLSGLLNRIDFSDAQLNDVIIDGDRLCTHSFMHINFSTYDRQRDQDLVNPRTRCNIMVQADPDGTDDNHPYLYGRVLQIFHADVRLRSSGKRPERIEFVWVRWYQRDQTYKSGWKHKRLHRLGFISHDDPGAFGLLDPSDIVRGIHLIPHFRYGRTTELLPRSVARQFDSDDEDDDGDWSYYCVNWFVDRDMISRFILEVFGPRLGLVDRPPFRAIPTGRMEPEEEGEDDDDDWEQLLVNVDAAVERLLDAHDEDMGGDDGGDAYDELQDADFEEEDASGDQEEESDGEDEPEGQEPDTGLPEPGSEGLRGDEAELDRAGLDRY